MPQHLHVIMMMAGHLDLDKRYHKSTRKKFFYSDSTPEVLRTDGKFVNFFLVSYHTLQGEKKPGKMKHNVLSPSRQFYSPVRHGDRGKGWVSLSSIHTPVCCAPVHTEHWPTQAKQMPESTNSPLTDFARKTPKHTRPEHCANNRRGCEGLGSRGRCGCNGGESVSATVTLSSAAGQWR